MDLRDTPDEAQFREELSAWLAANVPDELRGHRGGAARYSDDSDPRVEPCALRGRLHRAHLAEGVRRRRQAVQLSGDLPRGDGSRRGAAAPRRDRARHGRPDDHRARHRGPEGPLPPASALGRGDLVPGLLRAGRGLRSLRRADELAPRGLPVRRRRPEGVVVVRAHRRLVHPRHAQRPELRAARGPHVPDRRHEGARRRGAAAAPDHGRGGVQRDLLHRRRGAGRERDRRHRRRLAGRDDDPAPRARHARLRAHGGARGDGREADRAGPRPRRDAAAARRDRPGVDRAAGAALHRLPVAVGADEDRHPRPRGVDPEAAVVGGGAAADEARARAARPRRPAARRQRSLRRLLAAPAAPQPRQHDRGRDLRDPAQHHRRARARAAEESR